MTKFKPFGVISLALSGFVLLSFPAEANHPVDVGNTDQVKTGKVVYQDNCAVCHGANLKGPENPADFDGIKPPRLDGLGHSTHHGDHVFYRQIKNGSRKKNGEWNDKGMPPFADTLSDREVWAAITFIKSTWTEQARMKQNLKNPGHGNQMGKKMKNNPMRHDGMKMKGHMK